MDDSGAGLAASELLLSLVRTTHHAKPLDQGVNVVDHLNAGQANRGKRIATENELPRIKRTLGRISPQSLTIQHLIPKLSSDAEE
jgi:hypothetical protein